MSSIVLALNPKWAQLILSGKKTYELRRVMPAKPDVKRIFIYETAPVSAVVGEVEVLQINRLLPGMPMSDAEINGSCTTDEERRAYFRGGRWAVIFKLGKPKTYRLPVKVATAPQGMVYASNVPELQTQDAD